MELDHASFAYREGIGQPGTDVPIRLANFKIYGGGGAPAATLGANNDVYFRSDGTLGAFIYQKRGGSWVATAA